VEVMSSIKVSSLSCEDETGKKILNNISFSLNSGEAIAIVGQSGSGKTTLAYCLTGIIPKKLNFHLDGKILIDDKDISNLEIRDIARRINIILQDYEVQIFGLTVEEDIIFGLENLMLEEKEIERRLEWVLKTFELEKYRNYNVSELSGGLKQRLAIASTVAMYPEFLVMDDPTSNLDWKGVKELGSVINILKNQGKGIIVMARRIKGLEQYFNDIFKLENGKLMKQELNNYSFSFNIKKSNGSSCNRNLGDAVIIENLWFKYSNEYVLKDINIKLGFGEVISIMGSNGSGKTTLVKHINGLLKPNKGRVLVAGRDTRKFSTAELSRFVGFVFQDPNKHITSETVWEETVFGCKNLGIPFDKAEYALKLLELYDKKDKAPYSLSMGEKVRLMIASVIATDPSILILDEPTTGQDEKTLQLIENIIEKMKENNKCIIVITHDSDFSLKVSDRIIVIKDGKVVCDSTPSKVLLDEEKLEEFELEPPSVLGRWLYEHQLVKS